MTMPGVVSPFSHSIQKARSLAGSGGGRWSMGPIVPVGVLANGAVGRERDPAKPPKLVDSYGLLLVVILAQFILIPFLDDNKWGATIQGMIMAAVLLLALRISHVSVRTHRIALAMVVLALVSLAGNAAAGVSDSGAFSSVLLGVLVLITPVVILRRIFSHLVISGQTVLGAICAYLLLGMAFAFAYHAQWALDHDAFNGNLGPSPQFGLLYFSYVTLATLGYGDITPVGQLARSFAMIESLVGQIFLVTLVAALVGNLGRVRRSTGRLLARTEEEAVEEVEQAEAAGDGVPPHEA